MTPVSSSNVEAIGVQGSDLVVEFKNGSMFVYVGAADEYDNIMRASSKGSYLARVIKSKYTSSRVN